MDGIWLEKEVVENVSLWVTRCSVLSSFGAHLILALFASIRRRKDSAVWRFPVWLAYQVTDLAAKVAIGKLYLDSASSSQQLFAFWVPFVLLHLGLPDNISAYSLEDNVLSWRQVVEMGVLLLVALIGAYNQRFMSGDRVLCPAFVMMLFLASYKFVERICALRRAGFARIRRAYKKKMTKRFSPHHVRNAELDSYDALLDAHGLLGVTMAAFADYSVHSKKDPEHRYCYRKDVVKVVEMELSLMYDILYTKAAVIHTCPGYIFRLASPPLTLTALLLFHFHSKEGQKGIDINITYTLLIGTLLLDVRCVLRALCSTWTYAFLTDTKCELLKKTLCCRRGWWYGLRRIVLSLDPSRVWRPGASRHRLWSRTIGQHNLLCECTNGTPMSKIGWEGNSESAGVRSLLEVLCEDIWKQIEPIPAAMPPQAYLRRRTFGEARRFGAEFDELVITWHIATDIFLLGRPKSEQRSEVCRKIKALSDYMMFLVAKRPDMLPGLKLHSLYKEIRHALEGINRSEHTDQNREKLATELQKEEHSNSHKVLLDAVKYAKLLEKLCLPPDTMSSANLLDQGGYNDWNTVVSQVGIYDESETQRRLLILVPAFQKYAQPAIILVPAFPPQPANGVPVGWSPEYVLKEFVLESWVRLLIFGSIRCSRDSHAKQLSCGGELTTIVWILVEHEEIVKVSETEYWNRN